MMFVIIDPLSTLPVVVVHVITLLPFLVFPVLMVVVVVITVFLVVLAFTHWFLQAPRPAEMGRIFVGTLALLCSLLLTVMVPLLTPLSLPHDIQQQTIYTVVSKPVPVMSVVTPPAVPLPTLFTAAA